MPIQAFHPFSPSHIAVLLLTVFLAALMVWMRRNNIAPVGVLEKLLVAALLLEWPASMYAHHVLGDFSKQNALPFHLCDVAAFAGALALLKRWPLAAEICYFFGLTGTFQGLLTPALREDFPHPRFIAFFLGHASVVVTAVYVVAGLKLTPRPRAPLRMMGWLLAYAGLVGVLNALLRTNYAFICQKPPSPSLMDVLGPWPFYILSLIAVATTIFMLLHLPFLRQRKLDLSLPTQGG